MDRETDIAIPRRVWENFIPADGARSLVRALSDAERALLTHRAAELEAGLAPFTHEQRDEVRAPLHALLGGFRSLRESGEDAETAVEVLLAVLREFPVWAIERACLRIVRREIDIDPPIDLRWAPSDAQIHAAVKSVVAIYRQALKSAHALLDAPVALPERSRPSRAEIEAKLGRKIGERPEPENPLIGYAQRVAADLARRKAEREAQETTGPPASAA